jgi:urocanate hydratase
VSWIEKARDHVKFTGLPARIGWLGYGERSRLALMVNEAGGRGQDIGPHRLYARSSRFRLSIARRLDDSAAMFGDLGID